MAMLFYSGRAARDRDDTDLHGHSRTGTDEMDPVDPVDLMDESDLSAM